MRDLAISLRPQDGLIVFKNIETVFLAIRVLSFIGMTSLDQSNPLIRIQQLKRNIEKLRQEHAEALKRATFVGMDNDEAKVCDERRDQIKQMAEELSRLQGVK